MTSFDDDIAHANFSIVSFLQLYQTLRHWSCHGHTQADSTLSY